MTARAPRTRGDAQLQQSIVASLAQVMPAEVKADGGSIVQETVFLNLFDVVCCLLLFWPMVWPRL